MGEKKKSSTKETTLGSIFSLARACHCSRAENRAAGSGAVFGRRLYNEIIFFPPVKSDTFGSKFEKKKVAFCASLCAEDQSFLWSQMSCSDKECSADSVGLNITLNLRNQTHANGPFSLPVTSWTHKKKRKKKSDTIWNIVHGWGGCGGEAINFVPKVNGISSS